MCVHMSACLCVYMCVHVSISAHVCSHVCIMCRSWFVCMSRVCTCKLMCVHICVNACEFMYIVGGGDHDCEFMYLWVGVCLQHICVA